MERENEAEFELKLVRHFQNLAILHIFNTPFGKLQKVWSPIAIGEVMH